MTSPTRRAELFAVEAEEFLADLERLTAGREVEDPERLVRGARSLRGAAMFAGFGTYARAAAGLEALARQLRAGTLSWDTPTREAILGALDTLRTLLPHGSRWDAAADREALALAERLERLGGSGPRPAAETAAPLTAGVRSFVARESALIAGSLERAARALSPLPPADALATVLERMRSLRGLGNSAELSPLPELLDAMEIATRTLLGETPPPPDVAEVFDEAARALGIMAREIGEHGRVAPPPELDRLALHLLTAYTQERDVVSILDLAPDGESAIVQQGNPPGPSSMTPVPIELVGVGDHLLLIADTLARPALPVVRDLRLFVLHRTLASMPSRSATAHFLHPLTATINGTIAQGMAGRAVEAFVAMLRASGRFLIDHGGSAHLPTLQAERDRLVVRFLQEGLAAAPPPLVVAHAPDQEVPVPDAPLAAPDEFPLPVVPIEALAPTDPREDPFEPITWDQPLEAVVVEAAAVPEAVVVTDITIVTVTSTASPHAEELSPAPTAPALVAPAPAVSLPEEEPPLPIVPIHTLLDTNDDDLVGTPIVPIEALMTAADRATVRRGVPREAPGEPGRLEAALRSRQRHQQDTPDATPSLALLLQEELPLIDGLCYRGEAAQARARDLHATLSQQLRDTPLAPGDVQAVLDELLDLVTLARHAA